MHLSAPQWFETLSSTNDHLIRVLSENPELPGGTVIVTADQTAGRGRFDRVWQSQAGDDLACSILVRAKVPVERVPCLSMAIGLGVSDALNSFGLNTQVKWPNDVLINGRKIAGILSEYVPEAGNGEKCCIVGIGINVNMRPEGIAAIDRPATSLFVETGSRCDVESVMKSLLEHIPPRVNTWEDSGFPAFRQHWESRDWGLGRTVTVGEGATRRAGEVCGYGDFGELILLGEDRLKHTVLLGDVTG